MTTLDTIRALIQDQGLYAKEQMTLVAGQLSQQVYYFPVIASSVIITGDATSFTVDEQNGVIRWSTAPGAKAITVEYRHVSLLDLTIQGLVDLQNATDGDDTVDLRLVAAQCLDSIATSQALIQKKIKLLDLETDGPSLAKALREHAKSLRDQVYGKESQESSFDIVEQINDIPGWREKVVKDWLRTT